MSTPETFRYYEPKYTMGKAMTSTLFLLIGILSWRTAMATIAFQNTRHVTNPASAVMNRPAEPRTKVDAATLFTEYAKNQIAADTKYKGHRLAVQGRVQGLYKDPWGKVVIVLESPDVFRGIRATLEDESQKAAAGLVRGVGVSLTCEGGERVIGSPTLTGCSID